MRGVFLQTGLEVKLEVTGDDFFQGDRVPCTLSAKNHGDVPRSLADLRLELAVGTLTKVKAKDSDAFEIVSTAELTPGGDLEPGEQRKYEWEFLLGENASVTDKAQSLYFLYGNSPDVSAVGQLPLTVVPHRYLQEVFRTMEMVFQFVAKGITYKDGWVVAKLKPPTSRRFSLVEELNLGCKRDNGALQLRFLFTVKKFDSIGSKVDVKKAKTEVVQRLEQTQYLFGGEFINQEALEASIDTALSEVSSGL
jgi:hypothetical protein